jgi:hypothetical protein
MGVDTDVTMCGDAVPVKRYSYRSATITHRVCIMDRASFKEYEVIWCAKLGIPVDNHVVYEFETADKKFYVQCSDFSTTVGLGIHEGRW